ncbi:chorismate mutase [Aestuariivirga sp. YIM B02566]|nr:chorismate mutase [Aestuariivirga sp. YIM B02566]
MALPMTDQHQQKAADALAELRRRIDGVDSELVALLAKRQRCVEEVIEIKRTAQLPARIPARIDEVLAHIRKLAVAADVEPDLAVAVWREMIEQFIAFEERQI